MATEVRRKRRRVAGELERMVGRRFGYQKDLKAPATAAQTVWRVEAVEEDEEGEERVWALDTARYTTAVEELEERCECFTKEVLDKVRRQLRRQAVGPSRWRMKAESVALSWAPRGLCRLGISLPIDHMTMAGALRSRSTIELTSPARRRRAVPHPAGEYRRAHNNHQRWFG